jgi:cell division protein FtsZ
MENYSTQGFSFDLPKGNSSIIKVIGVGGGGNNALMHMYEKGIHGVDFIICNTDAQTLDNNPVSNKVQLGVTITEGLGAGADPEVGEKAAIESIDDIKAALGQNTKMVFITAGMGGGTGTGAAPVIAKIAKEMGILTVGIVTVPFSFEGRRRLDQADIGLEKLRNNVDSLIVINNDKLRQQFGNLGFKQGFSKADEVLTNAAKGMAEVITAPFTINIDFRDAKSVLQNSGTALMSTGIASGEKRAEEAVRKALDSPLLNDNKITGAKDVLLLIQSGSEEATEATMDEIGLINDYIQSEAGNTANIIFGVGTDEELGAAIKVLVIATGFANDNRKNTGPVEKIKINLEDFSENSASKPSPFRSRTEREELEPTGTFGSHGLFRLDQEDEPATTGFQTKSAPETFVEQPKNEFRIVEKEQIREEKPSSDFRTFEAPAQDYDLFSFEDDSSDATDLQAQSFTFETEDQPEPPVQEAATEAGTPEISSFSEEKAMEFSFFVNEPINETLADFSTPQEEIKPEPVQKSEELKAENTISEITGVKNETLSPTPAAEEEFTFINKTVDQEKVFERRNKLKEFNSRYQVTENENDFETIPAFKRKNISIENQNASQQKINTYLSENSNGQMQVRENRFLNKDVD